MSPIDVTKGHSFHITDMFHCLSLFLSFLPCLHVIMTFVYCENDAILFSIIIVLMMITGEKKEDVYYYMHLLLLSVVGIIETPMSSSKQSWISNGLLARKSAFVHPRVDEDSKYLYLHV